MLTRRRRKSVTPATVTVTAVTATSLTLSCTLSEPVQWEYRTGTSGWVEIAEDGQVIALIDLIAGTSYEVRCRDTTSDWVSVTATTDAGGKK